MNSDKFLALYNAIDDQLRLLDGCDVKSSFYSVIERVSRKNRTVERYARELKRYGDLRNAIVHSRTETQVIAEPNDYAVNELQDILEKIKSPKRVYDLCRHEVLCVNLEDSFADVLSRMKQHDFSQLPVYRGEEFCQMLNSEVIAAWLKDNLTKAASTLSITLVEDVLKYTDQSHRTLFRSRETTVDELIELYQKNAEQSYKIDAVIITHSGSDKHKPLTIITDDDIPALLEYL